MVTSATFWDRVAERYAARPIDDVPAYEASLERVRAYLAPGDRVLEVGCGTGTTALRLAPGVAELTALDISGEMVRIARGKAEAEGARNVSFARAGLEQARPEAAPFDAVLAFNLLHLLDDLPAALGRVRDLLRPGGLFISKTPALAERSVALRLVVPLMTALGRAPRVRFLRPEQLEAAVTGAGFEIVERGDYPQRPRSRFLVARRP